MPSQTDLAEAARTQFETLYGAAPDGVWSAPGRVNLIGEHVDYNGGLCLPMAIPQRTHAAARRREDRVVRVSSGRSPIVTVPLDEVRPGHPSGWAAYPVGVLWALERAGHPVGGADIRITSDVPSGAGLSSSAAIEAAVAVAADGLWHLGLADDDAGRAMLAAACQRAENDIVGAPTGGMDQTAALRAREAHALLLDCRTMAGTHVPFAHEVLVIDTRTHHALVDGQYAVRRAECERAAADLGVSLLADVSPTRLEETLGAVGDPVARRRARHVVSEIERVRRAGAVLSAAVVDLAELGRLFTASHASLRDDFEVSSEELDVAVDAALDAGALGARMTGGGFGGSVIALVVPGGAGAVVGAVRRAFRQAGWRRPRTFLVSAGAAAGADQTASSRASSSA
jgi:galactokinase